MEKMTKRIVWASSLAVLLAGCGETDEAVISNPAERVFINAAVYTVDDQRSWSEALAIDEGLIVYVGDDAGAEAYIGDATEVIDLDGQMVLPGFHDSHVHILIGVLADDECDLLRIPSELEVAKKLKQCTEIAGIGDDAWVIGGGWGEWLWPDANPQKGLLDLLFPDRPVYLTSSFGHADGRIARRSR